MQGQADGILLSMRPADELEYLSQQLTKVQAFAELLRVQTHDYSNKLNLIGPTPWKYQTTKTNKQVSHWTIKIRNKEINE